MNRIDITKTQHHYHCNNNVVVVTKRDGIQGPPGKEGITPHIDPETFHWFIGDVDTGIYAGMSNTDDITLLYLFDNRESFPSVGNVKDLYLDTETSTIYRWNAFSSTFVMFKADYVKELERAIVEAQTKLNNLEEEALKKPRVIVPGSLILAQSDGTVKCSDITYDELLEKIDEGGKVDFPTNLTPDALLVGSESGGIESSEISRSELIAVIENSKNNVKFVGDVVPNSLVLVDETGNLQGSSVSNDVLLSTIEKANTAARHKGVVVPGAMVYSTSDGNIKSSGISHDALKSLIEDSKNAVKYVGDIKHRSVVLADESGGIDSSDIEYSELVNVIEKSKNSVAFENEVKSNFVVIAGENGGVKSSNVTHNELIAAVRNSKNALRYEGETIPGYVLISGDESTGVKNSSITHNELIAAVKNSQNSVSYEGVVTPDKVVLSTNGGIKSSALGYDELVDAVESSKTAVKYKGTIVPGSLVLSTEDGKIESSGISKTEIVDTIDKAKTAVQRNNAIVSGSLIVGTTDGKVESSNITQTAVETAITKAETAVQYKGTIVPSSLILATSDGKIESSDITHSELLAVIESTKNCVKFDGDIIHNSLVLADKSGNIKSSGKTFNQLIEELKNSGIQADWNETNNDSPAFIKNKPDVVEKTEYDSLVEVVRKKSGFLSTPITGNLVTSDSSGNLYSTTLNVNNVVTADTIVAGSFSDYVIIEEDLVKTVTIPESVMQYITIDVYHNGKLLVPEIHYLWEADDYIDLVGFTANRDDIFSFVGHGVTTTMTPFAGGGIGGCDHSHMNLEVLDGITQEKVDSWDSSTKIFSENGTIISTYLPVATQDTLGVVKSSDGINNVRISDEGIMSVNSIDVSTLVSIDDGVYGGEDYSVVLSSGSSFSYKKIN